MSDRMTIPGQVATALEAWLGHHDRLAPGVIEGLYVVGSVALGDFRVGSDIDIVAFTADPADDAVAAALEAAHDAARSELADVLIDGPRLAWADVSVPPVSALRSWTLDGAFRFDGDCFELNPVTWFTLANHGVAVRGVPTGELDVAVDVAEMRSFVRENVDTYWRSVADQLAGALADDTKTEFDADVVTWCVLGVARMLFTTETGRVVSKSAAGEWATERLPEHRAILLKGVDLRRDGATPGTTVDRDVVAAVRAVVVGIVDRIVD